ncbi:transport-associated protein [Caballeronia calidae]|jgi:hyperosmotically inducible periplasmic protein|uniref:Transport-associated protein n=1 Tax=Caballeronia calidae TaxID=1777139 RepID=A0A158AXY5_9BURK|nr:BON domain-containing protein [Caballeronia calidae]SAK62851.1 transport-associated protein [Caballeronia calidae]
MNAAKILKLAGVLIVLASGYAWSQPGSASGAQAASTTPASGGAGAPKQSNRALRRAVYAAFGKDKSIDAGSIGVSAKNGAVTLTGTVDEASQIDKAATLAKGVPGVVSVQNKLTVKRGFSQ